MENTAKVNWDKFLNNSELEGNDWREMYEFVTSFEIDENEVITTEGLFKGQPVWVAHVYKVAQMNKESNTSRCGDWLTRVANLIKEDLTIFPSLPYKDGNVYIAINDFTGEIRTADNERRYEFEKSLLTKEQLDIREFMTSLDL